MITTIKDDTDNDKREERRQKEEAEKMSRIKDKAKMKESHRKELMKQRDQEITELETEKKEI